MTGGFLQHEDIEYLGISGKTLVHAATVDFELKKVLLPPPP